MSAEDDLTGNYSFKDLVRLGIVRDRSDLSRKIKYRGFPKPKKDSDAMQAAARYSKRAVHEWDERGETNAA